MISQDECRDYLSVGRIQSLAFRYRVTSSSGLVTFIFGSITLIFFILIQLRVYNAYSQDLQYETRSLLNSCRPVVIHGALISIILTYFNFLLFIGIYILVLHHACYRRYREDEKDVEMKVRPENTRF